MAITTNDNLQNNSPKALDNKYLSSGTTVYTNVAQANSAINAAYRSPGLTVLINDGGVPTEYWYREGTDDVDLVVKSYDSPWLQTDDVVIPTTVARDISLDEAGSSLTITGTNASNRSIADTFSTDSTVISNTDSATNAAALTLNVQSGSKSAKLSFTDETLGLMGEVNADHLGTSIQKPSITTQTVSVDTNTALNGKSSIAKLSVQLAANRTLTVPNGLRIGELLYIDNQNNTAFRWTLSGAVQDYNTTAITTIENRTIYSFYWDGSNWRNLNPVLSNTYYVSPNGSDTADGLSEASPWATITKVNAANLKPGDKVLFQGNREFTGKIVPKAGTAGKPITYGSYGGGRATIFGSNQASVQATDVGNIVIRDLICKGINQGSGWTSDGIVVEVGYSTPFTLANVSIVNCDISGFAGGGITFYCASASSSISNILVEDIVSYENLNGIVFSHADAGTTMSYSNVKILHCKTYDNYGSTAFTTSHTGSGIILGGCSVGLIEFCEAYNNGWRNGWANGGPFGIWTYNSANVTIRNCESHGNGTGTGSARKDGGGFDIDGGSNNCVIERCYAHGNAGAGFALYEYGSPYSSYTNNAIRNNISIGNGKLNNDGEISFWTMETSAANNRVHNNLFISDGVVIAGTPSAINFVSSTLAFGQLNIFNNIFIVDGSNSNMLNGTVQGTWSNNQFFALNSGNLNYSTGGSTGDPLLRNYSKHPHPVGAWGNRGVSGYLDDYKLLVTSPCIDAGLGTLSGYVFPTKDFFGGPVPVGTINIGPHELTT